MESYQSLYLKTYFPAEFMVAVINNFGGFYNRELYFRELKKTGVKIHPPCVNDSDYATNIKGKDVHVGFIHVEKLEQGWITAVLEERKANGRFLGLADFVTRTQPHPAQLEILIRIGAFHFTGKRRRICCGRVPRCCVKRLPTLQGPGFSGTFARMVFTATGLP